MVQTFELITLFFQLRYHFVECPGIIGRYGMKQNNRAWLDMIHNIFICMTPAFLFTCFPVNECPRPEYMDIAELLCPTQCIFTEHSSLRPQLLNLSFHGNFSTHIFTKFQLFL